jgi:pyruvate kinase
MNISARLILVITETGSAARLVAKYRPKQLILALCMSVGVIRQLNASRGVAALKIPSFLGIDHLVADAMNYAKESGYIKSGDDVVCLLAQNEESPDSVNIMKVASA